MTNAEKAEGGWGSRREQNSERHMETTCKQWAGAAGSWSCWFQCCFK